MTTRARPGLQVLIAIMSLAATLFIAPTAFATENQSSGPNELPYRVRYGAPWRGEIENRFFIERNIKLATDSGIVGDYDPDGDGWAIVGHTDKDYDGKKIGWFMISKILGKKVPSITLYWDNDTRCASLTPISLDVVKPDEDRLLKATIPRMCFAPSTDVSVVTLSPEPVAVEQPAKEVNVAEQVIVPITPAAPMPNTTHEPILVTVSPVDISKIPQGHVQGVSTTKQVNYFDGPGKNSAEVVSDVKNTFLIGAGVMAAVLLGIVFLVRFMMAMKS